MAEKLTSGGSGMIKIYLIWYFVNACLRCVLGEMFLRHPILPGNSDLDQLEKIWQMCGTPNQHTWPNFDTLPGCEGVKHHNQHPKRLKSVFEQSVITTSVVCTFG